VLLKYDRLLPYIYSLAGRVTTDNYTLMRALTFDFRQDKNVYGIPDQYMFGPAFLVNLVTQQLYSGSHARTTPGTRKVYLPAAAKWYDFWPPARPWTPPRPSKPCRSTCVLAPSCSWAPRWSTQPSP
jgi:alpha-D-xyloside xylohydrolase